MNFFAYQPCGCGGTLVSVEVEIRGGLPGFDLVGLAGNAVKESRERVRAAIRNAGFKVPSDRVLVSLAPAGVPKDGSAYDLPIALAILVESGQMPDCGEDAVSLGELTLAGMVRPVPGILAAVAAAVDSGVRLAIVPRDNVPEAGAIGGSSPIGVASLVDVEDAIAAWRKGTLVFPSSATERPRIPECAGNEGDFGEVKGRAREKRAIAVAAAGFHPILLSGPPGSGKTMMLRRMPGIMADLAEREALEASTLHSLAGALPKGVALLRRPPFRCPHHSASPEGILGGGRFVRPGEISLAHRGVLFLDEAPEFRTDVLQALREPVEDGVVSIARAQGTVRLPARSLLAMAANACPCGNTGKARRACVCSFQEVQRYWRKIGGALLDRVDIRLAVTGTGAGEDGPGSRCLADAVGGAVELQARRLSGSGFSRNSELPPALVRELCRIPARIRSEAERLCETAGFSSRAFASVLKVARTCADLDGSPDVEARHVEEAVSYREYCDTRPPWELA